MEYREVQQIAKDTMQFARQVIKPGIHLQELRTLCETKMMELGADSFWYWDVGAFVFAGDETTVSISGKLYQTSDRCILPDDIITIDLSPQSGDTWGDYARTIILQNGIVAATDTISNCEWKAGIMMEEYLHRELHRFVTTDTTFDELYSHMNAVIEEKGFVNLDFSGNLGHSIVRRKEDRIYIEKGNLARLKDVAYFTFEPHICVKGSSFGYKMENIYYFDGDSLLEL